MNGMIWKIWVLTTISNIKILYYMDVADIDFSILKIL